MLIIPEIFRNYSFLGIDPGLTQCGISIFNIDDSALSSIDALTIESAKVSIQPDLCLDYHTERQIKMNKLCAAYRQILIQTRPVLVCCESPFYNPRMPAAFGSLTETVTALRLETNHYSPNVSFITYAPQEVKQSFKRSGKVGKDVMKDALTNDPFLRQRLLPPFESLDEHAIDSIAVGYTMYLNACSSGAIRA